MILRDHSASGLFRVQTGEQFDGTFGSQEFEFTDGGAMNLVLRINGANGEGVRKLAAMVQKRQVVGNGPIGPGIGLGGR